VLLCEAEAQRFDDAWDHTAAVLRMMTQLHSKTPIALEEARPPRRRAFAATTPQLTKADVQRELRSLKGLFRG